MTLPSSCALQAYESLRAAVVEGRAQAPGAAALRYHGMWQGLAILGRSPASAAAPVTAATSATPLLADHAFVRLLANLVLRTHEELLHVY